VADATRQQGEERDQGEREQRQLPAQQEHADHRRDDCGHVRVIDVAVFVTTVCTPPMSVWMPDCTSPGRLLVKNASDSRCRWRKTLARRSCITRWPTWLDSSV